MKKVIKLVNQLIENKETISTMESCTGGFVASTITNADNSSQVLKYSCITYSNEFKIKSGVKKETIDKYSVYSIEVAKEMSKCISKYTDSTYGVGITGKINRTDINNQYGNDNEVFISIYNSKDNTYKEIKLLCPNKTREKVKKYITNIILNNLIKITKLNN